jgi:hypothetical protein
MRPSISCNHRLNLLQLPKCFIARHYNIRHRLLDSLSFLLGDRNINYLMHVLADTTNDVCDFLQKLCEVWDWNSVSVFEHLNNSNSYSQKKYYLSDKSFDNYHPVNYFTWVWQFATLSLLDLSLHFYKALLELLSILGTVKRLFFDESLEPICLLLKLVGFSSK